MSISSLPVLAIDELTLQYSVYIHMHMKYAMVQVNNVLGMLYTCIKFVLIVLYVQLLPYHLPWACV